MKRWIFAVGLNIALFVAGICSGQQPNMNVARLAPPIPEGSPPTMTPDMWLYMHEQRRSEDPAYAVRRRAELKGAQRDQRLAAMKWFGFSNMRPQASAIPFMGTYSPQWVGNGSNSFHWVGNRLMPTSVINVEYVDHRR